MFSLKHVIWNGGFETIYQAKEVRAKFPDPLVDSIGQPGARCITPEFVAFDEMNGDVRKLEFGTVYVMNESGKTVSKYDICPTKVGSTGVPVPSA